MRRSHCQCEGGGFGLQKETQACGTGWNRVMMRFLLDKALHVGRTNEVAGKTSRTAQSCEHGETQRLNLPCSVKQTYGSLMNPNTSWAHYDTLS